ncbi:MAG TPA: hypothetical protein PLE48_00495 [Thiobacillus sp.]|nr:MAG: hypothetical protein B7Y50_05845 [Hydrogenophilales bacterium 28-61-11]OYZ57433.1 MAG: hypothetical protein B7Y21_07650 [Hydrogenophilales bacterium 16-61-112]OZA50113.1 MAG: hypothetical protein B7X81_01810 [Hydrogenophilales bacterium 17-61-76]HQT30500.1 hypothetical protein [Thiobacillus sp.]HQT68888.1 hypothetical protein [Thiobacillus sp.]
MSKVSSKLVAGVSKVIAKQAAEAESKKPMDADVAEPNPTDNRPPESRPRMPAIKAVPVTRKPDVQPMAVWPD